MVLNLFWYSSLLLSANVRFRFFSGFHPNWEFRGFVSQNVRTCLTAYNPWIYESKLVEKKEKILNIITTLWDVVEPKVRSDNYSIDFAVSPLLNGDVWVVEINNFLPPLAGSGLFHYHDESDRTVLAKGPFEFRVRETPVKREDFVWTTVEENTGKTRVVTMQPAPDHVMRYVENLRREKEGMAPVVVVPVEEKKVVKVVVEQEEKRKRGGGRCLLM